MTGILATVIVLAKYSIGCKIMPTKKYIAVGSFSVLAMLVMGFIPPDFARAVDDVIAAYA